MSEAYGLIGHPLGHSMSPFLHKALFALGGKDASYRLLDLAPATMEQQVQEMTGYRGWNVTIPYKERIIPLLDRLDPSAARYNAVNCVRREPDGTLTGYNTDCTGFLHAVRDFSLGGRVLLLGCGGAGRMMATDTRRLVCSWYPSGKSPGTLICCSIPLPWACSLTQRAVRCRMR